MSIGEENAVLGQNKKESYAGDFVLNNQETGDSQGFSHVSKTWLDKCMSFDEAREKLAEDQQQIKDWKEPIAVWEPIVTDDGGFGMRHKIEDRVYIPTEHAIKSMASNSRMSTWMVNALREPVRHVSKVDKSTGEKVIVYNRDRRDSELLVHMFNVHMFQPDRMDQNKTRLWRTWENGTLRAFLSEDYAIINNQWYMDLLSKLIPGGLASHWRGDADAIYGNILIPDTLRSEDDSDYGGMLSISNSEIGTRRISSLPSVFRAICMNGCIWDQESGSALDKVHRGAVNLMELAEAIKENLNSQIPLLNSGIDLVLALKVRSMGDAPLYNVFAQLGKDYGITKDGIKGVIKAFGTEIEVLGLKNARSAFGVMSAVTRYGQELDNDGWVKYDEIGGTIATAEERGWEAFLSRAKTLSDKEIEKVIGVSAGTAA